MKHLRKMTLILVGTIGMGAAALQAEATCARCEEIRADNAVNHKNYEYYEDYLKDQSKGGNAAKTGKQNGKPAARSTTPAQTKNGNAVKNTTTTTTTTTQTNANKPANTNAPK